MTTLIRGARVIEPSTHSDRIEDILIQDNIITKRAENITDEADNVIEADGMIAMPGLIDLHVHLRDPGFEYKETVATGTKAAAAGGVTTVFAMPNTKPVTDNVEIVTEIINKAKEAGYANVSPVAAVTIGQEGKVLTDLEALKKAGIVAISEDGKSVMDTLIYKQAMENAGIVPKVQPIRGVINEGRVSKENNIPGISNSVEDIITARDIILAGETGAKLHLCHCSTAGAVKMIEEAKKAGISVTGEVCPHHFTLSEDDIDINDANYKMNPPLRTREDVKALIEGLKNDVMDVISTDHAPHSEEEKKGIIASPFGIVGIETSVALTITELVDKGYLTFMQMAEKMSYNPARITGIDRGTLLEGKEADIVLIDPEATYAIDVNTFASKGKNTPFNGKKVKGRVMYTILSGKVVYQYN